MLERNTGWVYFSPTGERERKPILFRSAVSLFATGEKQTIIKYYKTEEHHSIFNITALEDLINNTTGRIH